MKFGVGPGISTSQAVDSRGLCNHYSSGNARNAKPTERCARLPGRAAGFSPGIVHNVPSRWCCKASLKLSRFLALAAGGTGVGVEFRKAGLVSIASLDSVQARSIINRGRETPVRPK